MRVIKSDAEFIQLCNAGKGLIYNDFSRRGPSGRKYNVLHVASCGWVTRSNVSVPKMFFEALDEATAWLRKNRGEEGTNWKRCGTCGAGAVVSSRSLGEIPERSRGVLSIDFEQFERRFQHFKKIDYASDPYCFGEFWKRKLGVEAKGGHILDSGHTRETYNLLGQTLKIWQWHRPDSFSKLSEKLKTALENSRDAYNQIRNYSLLEFDKIPAEPLELIWHELGCIKSEAGKNTNGFYLVMPATKPLMFLWGQTLAFDSVVRRRMATLDIRGLNADYWSYETWKKVMAEFQRQTSQQLQVTSVFKNASSKEYGTDRVVPYGQFWDLYYWARDR